jgi:hypothetical protein
MTTAAELITGALRMFGIVDQTESPTPTDIANGVVTLNDLLRNEQADGAAQYLISMVNTVLPPGAFGQIYTFSIGTADAGYLVQQDAVGVRQMWMNDVSLTVNRPVRFAPKTDVVRTTQPGIVTKMHQERQWDGSVLMTAWQSPRAPAKALIEIGGRVPLMSKSDGSDVVKLPPEGIADAKLLFGQRVCAGYGRGLQDVAELLKEAVAVNNRWREWARGQQWMQFVRA